MPSSWIDVLETVVHFVLRPVFTETLLGTAVEKWSGNWHHREADLRF